MQQRRLSASVIVSLAIAGFCIEPAAAETEENTWHLVVPAFLSATLRHQDVHGSSEQQLVFAGLVEWRFRQGYRPWSIGPLVEVRLPGTGPNDSVISPGVIFRHKHQRWDTTAVLFRQLPSHTDASSGYGARLRYRISPSSKLGVEVFGPVSDIGSSTVLFGLYANLSDTLTFRLHGGTRLDRGDTRIARIELIWQVR